MFRMPSFMKKLLLSTMFLTMMTPNTPSRATGRDKNDVPTPTTASAQDTVAKRIVKDYSQGELSTYLASYTLRNGQTVEVAPPSAFEEQPVDDLTAALNGVAIPADNVPSVKKVVTPPAPVVPSVVTQPVAEKVQANEASENRMQEEIVIVIANNLPAENPNTAVYTDDLDMNPLADNDDAKNTITSRTTNEGVIQYHYQSNKTSMTATSSNEFFGSDVGLNTTTTGGNGFTYAYSYTPR